MSGVVAGVLIALTEEAGYDVDERVKLLGYCREALPSIVPRLSGPSQAEVLQRLDALAMHTKAPELEMHIALLGSEVRAGMQAKGQR
jgi:hypothetical protein